MSERSGASGLPTPAAGIPQPIRRSGGDIVRYCCATRQGRTVRTAHLRGNADIPRGTRKKGCDSAPFCPKQPENRGISVALRTCHDDFHQPENSGKTGRIGGHPAVDLPARHESSHVRDQELRQDLRRVRGPALGCVCLGNRIIRAPRQRLAAARRDRLGFPAGWMEPGPRTYTRSCVIRRVSGSSWIGQQERPPLAGPDVVPISRQVRLCVEKNFYDRPAVRTRERRILRIDLPAGQNIVQAAVDALANRRGQAVE